MSFDSHNVKQTADELIDELPDSAAGRMTPAEGVIREFGIDRSE